MITEANSNFDTDFLSSFENSDDEGDGLSALPTDSPVRTKMFGVLKLYKGVEKLGSDKYASHDEEETLCIETKKNKRNNIFSRKKKLQDHDEYARNKQATVRITVAKREKLKRLSKLKKKKRALADSSRVSPSAAAAPVRLADILGGVGDVEYSTGRKGSWRSKMERKNSLKSDFEGRRVQAEFANDEEISVLSKSSKDSKDSFPRIYADTSNECDRHKGYIVDPIHRSSVEDDAFRDESETTRLFGKQSSNHFEDSRQDTSNTQELYHNSTNQVMKLDKYIVPSPSIREQPSLATTTIRMLLKSSIVAARAQKWDDVLRLISSHP